MPRRSKSVATFSDRREKEPQDHVSRRQSAVPRAAKIGHSDYVRGRYKIEPPKAVTYLSGDTNFDRQTGECRDEQAWTAALEYTDHAIPTGSLQLAVLYLRPGVSKREARRAIDRVFAAFPQKPKPKRPAIRPIERQLLREIFERGEKEAGGRVPPVQLIRFAVELNMLFHKWAGWPRLSKVTIQRECERWRAETGRPIRSGKEHSTRKVQS